MVTVLYRNGACTLAKWSFTGRSALVTGASSGIGEQFARQLAARGCRLVLVARTETRLRALAEELTLRHGVFAEVVPLDASRSGAAGALAEILRRRGIEVDLLVNNAGFGNLGSFVHLDPDGVSRELAVNITFLVELTRALLPAMVTRSRGAVLNVASLTAFQPVPGMAVYAAAKAFVLSFSLALAREVGHQGVRVVALCPGTTRTDFFVRAGLARWDAFGGGHAASLVARAGLRAVERDRTVWVVGARNRLIAGLSGLLPRGVVARIAEAVTRRRGIQEDR